MRLRIEGLKHNYDIKIEEENDLKTVLKDILDQLEEKEERNILNILSSVERIVEIAKEEDNEEEKEKAEKLLYKGRQCLKNGYRRGWNFFETISEEDKEILEKWELI